MKRKHVEEEQKDIPRFYNELSMEHMLEVRDMMWAKADRWDVTEPDMGGHVVDIDLVGSWSEMTGLMLRLVDAFSDWKLPEVLIKLITCYIKPNTRMHYLGRGSLGGHLSCLLSTESAKSSGDFFKVYNTWSELKETDEGLTYSGLVLYVEITQSRKVEGMRWKADRDGINHPDCDPIHLTTKTLYKVNKVTEWTDPAKTFQFLPLCNVSVYFTEDGHYHLH